MAAHRLLLIRHAKTEDGEPDVRRQLTQRGRSDAADIGARLNAHGVVPDFVVVSQATRAQQTWRLAAEVLATPPPSTVDERVYRNTPGDLMAIARESDESIGTLAIVGHNPSIETLSARWGGSPSVKTGTVVQVHVDGAWADLSDDSCRVVRQI